MSAVGVREMMLDLMSALDGGAIALEGMADELAQAAEDLSEEPGTGVMIRIARDHRVRALEMRGQFAALSADYVRRFHPEL